MESFQVSVTSTATSIYALTGRELCQGVLLQAPSTNSGLVYYGGASAVVMEIDGGGSAGLDVTNTKDIYIKGTTPDKLNILLT